MNHPNPAKEFLATAWDHAIPFLLLVGIALFFLWSFIAPFQDVQTQGTKKGSQQSSGQSERTLDESDPYSDDNGPTQYCGQAGCWQVTYLAK